MTSRGSDTGISLVEVVVSLALLAVGLLGLAAAFPPTRAAVSTGNQVSIAVSLARQTLEDMRNRRYTSTVDEITAATFPNEGYGGIANFPTFRRAVTVRDGVPQPACTPPPGTPCTKTVTVTVFYRDHVGQEQAVSLITTFVR